MSAIPQDEVTRQVRTPNLRRLGDSPSVTSVTVRKARTVFGGPVIEGSITPDRLSDLAAPTFSFVVQGNLLALRTSTGVERRLQLPFVVTKALAVDFNHALCFSRGVKFDPSEVVAAPMLFLAGYDPETRATSIMAIDMNSGARFGAVGLGDKAPKNLRVGNRPGAAPGLPQSTQNGLGNVRIGRSCISFDVKLDIEIYGAAEIFDTRLALTTSVF